MRLRNIITNFGLFLVAACIMLLLVELLARLFVPQWTPDTAHRNFWAYDDLLGWVHKPNRQGTFEQIDFSVNVSINSDGLRDKEYPLARTQGKKRLLVLGDSFGWGFGVENDEIFSELLEKRHPDWEIINASVSGYGTDQQLLYLKQRGMQYQPDVVLLLFHPNDVANNSHSEQYVHNKARFQLMDGELVLTNYPVPKPSFRQRAFQYIVGNTYFFGRLYRVSNLIESQWRPARAAPAVKKDNRADYMLTTELLLTLNDLVKQNGAQLVVVSVPISNKSLKNLLRDTLQAAEIPYLPLDEALANSPEPVTFEHDEHWNPAGHKIVATTIENFLVDLNIFRLTQESRLPSNKAQ
ncbi:MAG TPA: GDSL-type esterase/lipase family protein [Anaerolineae bacterium]|nr:GDSL-type esterase/lipase family protein [Anaerolineae bacterium]